MHVHGHLSVCTCDRVTLPGSSNDSLALVDCSNASRTLSDQDTVMCGDHDDESWSRASPLVVMECETRHPECTVQEGLAVSLRSHSRFSRRFNDFGAFARVALLARAST